MTTLTPNKIFLRKAHHKAVILTRNRHKASSDTYFFNTALASIIWACPYVISRISGFSGHRQQLYDDIIQYYRNKYHTENSSPAGGDPVACIAELTETIGYYYWTKDHTPDELWQLLLPNCLMKKTFNPMVCWTYDSTMPTGCGLHLESNSSYIILGYDFHIDSKRILLCSTPKSGEDIVSIIDGLNEANSNYQSWTDFLHYYPQIFSMDMSAFRNCFAGLGLAK